MNESVWEPDRVRVSEWAGPGDSFMTMSEEMERSPPLPCRSSDSHRPFPLACGWRLLGEHRKGGREVIGHTAVNNGAEAV